MALKFPSLLLEDSPAFELLARDQIEFDAHRTEPIEVAKLIAKVLEVKKPKVRYQIGYMSKMGAFLEKLPQSWVDYIMEKREN